MRRDHGSQKYYKDLLGRSGDQVTFIVTQSHSNFVYVQRDQNFYNEKRRLSSFIISMTLDWGANENTKKLPVTRQTCHALIYGARSVFKKETRQEVDRENPSIQRKHKNVLLLHFRPPSIMTRSIGAITMNTTAPVERLGLTNRKQNYPPTGTHHSPRSVSE